jgi:tRNA pseudouridine55 synthase
MLVVNKPRGMISKDVSRWLTRRFGKLKLGHVGTLDPLAEGVLPILFGSATRLQDYLLDHPKQYLFDMQLGTKTDTLDVEGQICEEQPFDHVTYEQLEEAGKTFLGEIEQIPPQYSAVKYQGKPLYHYARKNNMPDISLEELKRKVTIHNLELKKFEGGVATFVVDCSKGTYVRVLASDIAAKCGTVATVSRIVRTGTAGVGVESSVKLTNLESETENLQDFLIPTEKFKLNMRRWRAIEPAWSKMLRSGKELLLTEKLLIQSLEESANIDIKETKHQILMLDEHGQAFGLGICFPYENGFFKIIMKRELK